MARKNKPNKKSPLVGVTWSERAFLGELDQTLRDKDLTAGEVRIVKIKLLSKFRAKHRKDLDSLGEEAFEELEGVTEDEDE